MREYKYVAYMASMLYVLFLYSFSRKEWLFWTILYELYHSRRTSMRNLTSVPDAMARQST